MVSAKYEKYGTLSMYNNLLTNIFSVVMLILFEEHAIIQDYFVHTLSFSLSYTHKHTRTLDLIWRDINLIQNVTSLSKSVFDQISPPKFSAFIFSIDTIQY